MAPAQAERSGPFVSTGETDIRKLDPAEVDEVPDFAVVDVSLHLARLQAGASRA